MTDIITIKKKIEEADAIVIGAGAGLSEAAGYHYSGPDFEKEFDVFIKKYGFTDLYTSSFYPFKSQEEKWAYWAKHIYYSYYENTKNELYENLHKLVKDKDYFVITTNVDGKFLQNGFERDKIFEVQGRYSSLQCETPCHNKLYDNKDFVLEAIEKIDNDLKIPSELVPKCPVCGENMNVNLRCDDTFVEDDLWNMSAKRYGEFLDKYKGKKVLFLEFGVGFNTPGIIRFPFEREVFLNHNAYLFRFNKDYPEIPSEIKERGMEISEDVNEVIELVNKLGSEIDE